MDSTRTEKLAALLKRLSNHIEHGGPIAEDDLMLAAYEPHALAYLGMKMGSLGRFKNQRIKGPATPLTQPAQAYIRAEAITEAVAAGMDGALDWVRARG